ncbi:uncharacterized protein LOC135703620 [Ochlerotatus camptorhynchus]|uniref:uncharacterized protein LOC135703620 n=1 Tax=Ochlerotatus camptorhynchus TaxID=644619 RepID=UPI0031D86465
MMPGPRPDLEKTGYSCAGCQLPDSAEDEMVGCDHCQRWYHFGCAGVTDEVKDISWSCDECVGLAVDKSAPTGLDEELEKLEKQMEEQSQALEKEKILHKKRLEHQRQMFLMRLQAEKDKREMELEFEKMQLEKELAEKEAHRKKRDQVLKQVQDKLKQVRIDPATKKDVGQGRKQDEERKASKGEDGHKKKTKKTVQPEQATMEKEKPGRGKSEKKKSEKHLEKADPRDASKGAYRKFSTPKKVGGVPVLIPSSSKDKSPLRHPDLPTKKKSKKQPIVYKESSSSGSEEEKEESEEESGSEEEKEDSEESGSDEGSSEMEEESRLEKEETSSEEEEVEEKRRPKKRHRHPTKRQLSARQFLSKKLPIFSGRLEEWPMFISAYETSNDACGFSDVENLARLQECLKGSALEAVRSRLLLPKAVPQIIDTLKMLYGRPEQLLNMLLSKVRKAPAPRADKLATFIQFGVVVQQLADHLEATDLTTHLMNPMLIQELTEKLPANTQLEWVRYRRKARVITLRTLADFLSCIARDASEITPYGDSTISAADQGFRKGKGRKENEGFLHTHSAEANSERSQSSSSWQREKKPCRICGQFDHRIRNCETFRRLRIAERWEAVRKWKLCYLCLNEHGNARCKLNFRCNVGQCSEPHNPLLHFEQPQANSNCNVHTIQRQQSVIFRMIPVTLYNGNYAVDTIAFLDEGSSYTLIEKSLATILQAKGVVQPLRVTWTAGVTRLEKDSRRVELCISALGSLHRFRIMAAHTVESLKLPQQTVAMSEVINEHPHLRGIPVSDFRRGVPQILIGLKDIHLYAPIESRIGRPDEPIAVKSKLGWTIYGPTHASHPETGIVGHHSCDIVSNEDLHDLLRSHYALDESMISVALLPESSDDKRAKEILNSTTVRIGNRFETGLLWSEDDPRFPDSYPMAVKRFRCLERRLVKDSNLYDKVRELIADYTKKGYIHVASKSELAEFQPDKVWYLPLSVVVHPKKPGKVRLVWDAAAAVNGVSLNSKLLKGPDMLTPLPSVLSKFREREVGFGGDIREMYLQMMVRKADKRARFVFRGNSAEEFKVYIIDVTMFGATSSPCSAQFVKNLNAKEYAVQFPEAAKAIVENHYVDDYFDSMDTVEQAVKRAQEVKYVHSKAGFEILNWVANSDEFLQSMGEQKSNKCVQLTDDMGTSLERVLGIAWCPLGDEFTFLVKLRDELMTYLSGEQRPTKRVIMSCVMSLFDPLGMLATFTIHGKILIQDLWRSGCDWDQPIDDECCDKWNRWISWLPEIENVKIPRHYFRRFSSVDYSTLQLHVLVDASKDAYGAAAYFRVLTDEGPLCSLVMARSKVAPLKMLSIPRLELQAAVIGSRLMNSVIEAHSLIQLEQRKYKPFVAFRIGEILSLTKHSEWRWISTASNIADDLTKWKKGSSLDSNGPWFQGPRFLYQPEEEWSQQDTVEPNTPEEARICHLFHDISIVETVIDATRFSRWKVLVRTVACIYRFKSNCIRKREGLAIEVISAPPRVQRLVKRSILTVLVPLKREEFQRAEAYLWRSAQAEAYEDEIKILVKNRDLPYSEWHPLEKNSNLYDVSPFLDEQGVLRMEGRTAQGSFLPFELRFPVILPKKHPITTKLLEYHHQQAAHANGETVVNELRQRFRIPNLRTELKAVTKACVWCRGKKCQPKIPRMAPLPLARVTPGWQPFSFTGVDYCGPLTVTVGRRSEKRWICLFTCLSTRAIHLEVAHSLTTQACLMAIRRFVCRRGKPVEFFSDNGTNFQGASKEIVRTIEGDCEEAMTDARTRWNFNPPSAPHMGGIWERLVRSVKAALVVFNDGRRLTDEVLLTTLAEAEDLINSRPLTYCGLGSDAIEALTPNHFVKGIGMTGKVELVPSTNEAEALRDSFKRALADQLWKRWVAEYLPTINKRSKWQSEAQPVSRGDLVYIADEATRKTWIRGVVVEVYPGADGRIRQASVKTAKGEYRRPVTKLAVLEVQDRKSGSTEGPSPELRGGGMCAPPSTINTPCAIPYLRSARDVDPKRQ